MEYKLIKAKCPYCKNEFDWIRGLTGEYAPSESYEKCSNCGNTCIIKATQIMKFSAAKKLKDSIY